MNSPASKPVRRDVHGIVLLDKPAGFSSNQALQRVKRLFRARKAGHTGSLDPLATGVLPICLGEATKVSGYLLDADKYYQAVCRLGEATTTGDAEGEVIARYPLPTLEPAHVAQVFAELHGPLEQIPPMYSALKHQGQRLYTLARAGHEVERAPRRVQIHALTLESLQGPLLGFRVHCSKGTYVRTLAEEIGARLGCGSAHLTALRRTGLGQLAQQRLYTLEALTELAAHDDAALLASLTPMDAALNHWPQIMLDQASAHFVRQGQAVFVPNAPTHGDLRLYDAMQRFIGLGQVLEDGRIAPKRLLHS